MIITPGSLNGTPQTMPTNNWWSGAGETISNAAKVLTNTVTGLATSYADIQGAKRLAQSGDVQAQNRPPGTFGLNPQAAGIAGAQAEGVSASGALSPGVLMAAALLVGFLLLSKAR